MPRGYREPEYRRRIRENAENQKQNAESERRYRESNQIIQGIVSEIRETKEQYERHESDHYKEWKRECLWKSGEIAALVLAAIVGVAAICVGNSDSFKQRKAMQAQLGEMRVEQRAWISVDPAIGGVRWDKDGVHIPTRFDMKNTGKSPALNALLHDELFSDLNRARLSFAQRLDQISESERHLSDNVWHGNRRRGFPIMPGDVARSFDDLMFTRGNIRSLVAYQNTFKSPMGKLIAPIAQFHSISLELLYVVDYFTQEGVLHQFSCAANISQIDPKNPLRGGLGLPVDVDLTASQVRLVAWPVDCGAD